MRRKRNEDLSCTGLEEDRLHRLRKRQLFCHSERSEESLLCFVSEDGGIPRFAQNCKRMEHFRKSLSQS
jgi:hypothetical protein